MTIRGAVKSMLIILQFLQVMPVAAVSEPSDSTFVVSPDQVARVLEHAGISATADRIQFLSTVRAKRPNTALRLRNADKWRESTLKVEIECADHRSCLPFYVLVSGTTAVPNITSAVGAHAPSSSTTHPLIRVGDRALLVFDDLNSRITVRVICVQSGDRGQTIRVVSADRKRFYQAEVIQKALLKGTHLRAGERS